MANVPIKVIKRQEKEYEYWQQKIRDPKAIQQKLEQEQGIIVSDKTVGEDLKDLEKQGKIKRITKEVKTQKRREIVKELYGKKGMTGEELRQETNKKLEEVFGMPFSFSMPVIEKDIKLLKDNKEVNEDAKEQRMEEAYLDSIKEDLKEVEDLTKSGKTIEQIAKTMGKDKDTVKRYKRILREQGRLTGKERPRRKATIEKEERMERVAELITNGEMTQQQIAEKEGVSKQTISKDKKRIKEAKKATNKRYVKKEKNKNKVRDLVEQGEIDKKKIAKEIGVSSSRVYDYLRELEELEELEKEKYDSKYIKKEEKKNKIRDLVEQGEIDKKMIAKEVGVSLFTVYKYLKEIEKEKLKKIGIKELCKNFHGQDLYLEIFAEYILECKITWGKEKLNQEELSTIRDIVAVTKKYEYIIFYLKVIIKLEKYEEALKIIRYQSNNEDLKEAQKENIVSLKEKVQLLLKSNEAKKMLKKEVSINEISRVTGLLETQVMRIRRELIQEQQKRKEIQRAQEGNEDNEEKQL